MGASKLEVDRNDTPEASNSPDSSRAQQLRQKSSVAESSPRRGRLPRAGRVVKSEPHSPRSRQTKPKNTSPRSLRSNRFTFNGTATESPETTPEQTDVDEPDNTVNTIRDKKGRKRPYSVRKSRQDRKFLFNWQRKPHVSDRMGRPDLTGATLSADNLEFELADGEIWQRGDYVYVLFTTGEPWYIGRISKFVPSKKPGEELQAEVIWLYRPQDVHRRTRDSRELFFTFNVEVIAVSTIRGKCEVRYAHGANIAEIRSRPSSFWVSQLFDRHMERFFDVVPTSQLTNLPLALREALEERYAAVAVEPVKARELTMPPRSCAAQDCGEWCSEEDSVTCTACNQVYHMACLTPQLVAKPSRGFAWNCAVCNRAEETRIADQLALLLPPAKQKRRKASKCKKTPEDISQDMSSEGICADMVDHGIETELMKRAVNGSNTDRRSTAMESVGAERAVPEPQYRAILAAVEAAAPPRSGDWPYRYLGTQVRLEDALDADDRVFPRGVSEIGSKHQAQVDDWPGRPFEFVHIPPQPPRRGRKPTVSASTQLRTEPWIKVAPPGYVERGKDETSELMWSSEGLPDTATFLRKTKAYARHLGIEPCSANFLDAVLHIFMLCKGDETAALARVARLTRKSLHEPTFSTAETRRFEEAVAQYGSSLQDVREAVASQPTSAIVRFYYMWKKTARGRRIWGSCQARASRRRQPRAESELLDTVQDPSDPQALWRAEGARRLGHPLQCKFCKTTHSREWRPPPAPMILPDAQESRSAPMYALCSRCGRLWYRYGVEWQEPETVLRLSSSRKSAQLVDPELVEDANAIMAESVKEAAKEAAREEVKSSAKETPRKRRAVEPQAPAQTNSDGDAESGSETDEEESNTEADNLQSNDTDEEPEEAETQSDRAADIDTIDVVDEAYDEKVAHMTAATARKAEQQIQQDSTAAEPAWCVVCGLRNAKLPQLACNGCGLSVHAACYGAEEASEAENGADWLCDVCSNDRAAVTKADTIHHCLLCPRRDAPYAAWLGGSAVGAPDAFKPTNLGRWAHIRCAVVSPNVTFRDTTHLKPVVLSESFEPSVGTCKVCGDDGQVLVSCDTCDERVHIGCAGKQGYAIGFKFSPGERDAMGAARFRGQRGSLSPVVRCSEHSDAGIVPLGEFDPEQQQTALQIYVSRYKATPRSRRNKRSFKLQDTTPITMSVSERTHIASGEKVCRDNGSTSTSPSIPYAQSRSPDTSHLHTSPVPGIQVAPQFQQSTLPLPSSRPPLQSASPQSYIPPQPPLPNLHYPHAFPPVPSHLLHMGHGQQPPAMPWGPPMPIPFVIGAPYPGVPIGGLCCVNCKTAVAPFWFPTPEGAQCPACHWGHGQHVVPSQPTVDAQSVLHVINAPFDSAP